MELLKLRYAAEILNISYPTLKQWIYRGKLQSIKTPGGHHRIERSEIDRLTRSKPRHNSPQSISGRNKLMGTIVDLKSEGLLSQVTLDIGGQYVTSIITRQECIFAASWTTRGSPADVIDPNPGDPITVFGAPSGGVFVRLKTSARTSAVYLSRNLTPLMRARSIS